jgi:signal transduction histidine kinase
MRDFEVIATASLDMIARQAPDRTHTYVSPAAKLLVGRPASSLLGESMTALCHPEDVGAIELALDVLERGASNDGFAFEDTRLWLEIQGNMARVRCRMQHAAGHFVWCEMVITAVRSSDDTLEEFVTVTRDITRVKLHERELEAVNRELEQRIEARTAQLAASNDELRAALDALQSTRDKLVQAEKLSSLGELVAGIAHEVNTPVGVGLTAASHLQDRAKAFEKLAAEGTITRADLDAFVVTAVDSAAITVANLQRAAQLIRSFKQVAADRSHESVRALPLVNYLNDVLLSLRPQLRRGNHAVELRGPEGFEITTAPGALSQVVTNLVMNSVRHGFEDRCEGQVCVEVEPNAQGGCTIHYRDDGAGIPEGHLRRIFDPFFTTQRGRGGTGLGLHIVFGLVSNVLQGSIDVASAPGEGTVFTIVLPASVDLSTAPPSPPSRSER